MTFFHKAVLRFEYIRKGRGYKKLTLVQKMMRQMRHLHSQLRYLEKVGQTSRPDYHLWRLVGNRNKRLWKEVAKNHDEEILCMNGEDLETLVRQYDIDPNLPVKQQQEMAHQAFVDSLVYGDPAWTKEQVARQKKHFLSVLEKVHFVEISAQTCNLSDKMVRNWMRSDPEFADGVYAAQLRMGQRIQHALIMKAVGEGDVGAMMYLAKEFKGHIPWFDQSATDRAQSTSDMDISKLSTAEQETLLHLLRKVNEDNDSEAPTNFIEEPEHVSKEEHKFIEHEVDALIANAKNHIIIEPKDAQESRYEDIEPEILDSDGD
jgi:hypothetical protein